MRWACFSFSFNSETWLSFDYCHCVLCICECLSVHSSNQWVLGLAVFLVPCSPISLRKLLKPVHVWFGGSILSLSIVACISGINEKLFFALWVPHFLFIYSYFSFKMNSFFLKCFSHSKRNTSGTQPYSKLPPEAVLGNTLGVLIVAFGLVVLKILSNPKWQRPDSRPEDTAYTVRRPVKLICNKNN